MACDGRGCDNAKWLEYDGHTMEKDNCRQSDCQLLEVSRDEAQLLARL